jgi:signal peptidase I
MKSDNKPTKLKEESQVVDSNQELTVKTVENTTNYGDSNPVHGFLTTALLFVAAIFVAFLLTAFVFQQYEVDGPSMQSTLQNKDRLIVVKLPKTWSKITGHPYVPPRGTIVIFNEGGLYNASGVQEKQLIKRVIGLPGDRVVIKDGYVTIYNKANPNGFDPDKTMPYGKVITYTSGDIDVIVQPNHVFVMGDNRPDSLDSRYFGQIPVSNIIGKLDVRIYPFNTVKIF